MRRLFILMLLVLLTACSSAEGKSSPPTPTDPPLTEPLCNLYPIYCVPFIDAAPLAGVETAGLREGLDPGQAAPGVVRGMTDDGRAFLGDPEAPVELAEVRDFGCPHCRDYHLTDLPRIFEDFVLTGEIQFSVLTVSGSSPTQTAALASVCAGEQGALWEMSDRLYHDSDEIGAGMAFSLDGITAAADDMSLDSDALAECINSGRYQTLLDDYHTFAIDNGVAAVPTILMRYRGQTTWTIIRRDYDTLRAAVEDAP
jgi:protein-disulfide isomerase